MTKTTKNVKSNVCHEFEYVLLLSYRNSWYSGNHNIKIN